MAVEGATCQSSLSAHFLSLRVSSTSATSLAPFPDRQLLVSDRSRDAASLSRLKDLHDDVLLFWQRLGQLHTTPETVRRLQCRDDTLEFGDHLESLKTLEVIGNDVFGSAGVFEMRVFLANRVVVKTLTSALGLAGDQIRDLPAEMEWVGISWPVLLWMI